MSEVGSPFSKLDSPLISIDGDLVFVPGFLRYTVKSLIKAHALINAHPPILTLKIVIFGAVFGKILASYKRPSEKNGGGGGGGRK